MKYRKTDEKMNGSFVYQVWRKYPNFGERIIGFVDRTKEGLWQIDIHTQYYGQRIETVASFKEAKQKIKEYWA